MPDDAVPDDQPPVSPASHHALAWSVLFLVFVLELAAWAAFGVWGWQADPRWLWVWLLPLLVIVVWAGFAAPRARYGGPWARPVVKALVFGGAVLALDDAGHRGWALLLLVAALGLVVPARWATARVIEPPRVPDG